MAAFTEGQLRALSIAPKPSAFLSFASSLYIIFSVLLSPDRRSRVYHRLCAAMALNGLVYSAMFFWGTWAMPSEMAEQGSAYVAGGSWGTCEGQGFMIQYGFAVPCYYCSLSLYSLLAIRNNFDQDRLRRFELCLHFVCNAVPLATAIVLQRKELLNPSGAWCWMGTYPPGCEGDECVRGSPEDKRAYMWAFAYGLIFFNLAFSTVMMGLLYWTIQRRQRNGRVFVGKKEVLERAKRARSRMVLRQAGQYLAAFYATYTMSIVSRLFQTATGRLNPTLHIIAVSVIPLQGFLYFLVYASLRVERDEGGKLLRVSIVPNSIRRISVRRLSLTKGLSEAMLNMTRGVSNYSRWGLAGPTTLAAVGEGDDTAAAAAAAIAVSERKSSQPSREFSIFDGTNCGSDSIWAQFLVDDDEDDDGEEVGGSDLRDCDLGVNCLGDPDDRAAKEGARERSGTTAVVSNDERGSSRAYSVSYGSSRTSGTTAGTAASSLFASDGGQAAAAKVAAEGSATAPPTTTTMSSLSISVCYPGDDDDADDRPDQTRQHVGEPPTAAMAVEVADSSGRTGDALYDGGGDGDDEPPPQPDLV